LLFRYQETEPSKSKDLKNDSRSRASQRNALRAWLTAHDRQKKMKRIAKWLVTVVVLYGVLWGLTVAFGGGLLERHLAANLKKEWRECRDEAESKDGRFPAAKDRIAFAGGPILKVRVISYPAPFICIAEVDRTIGGLNGRGAVGKYLLTPWRIYILREHGTWVS
jgi:hypothetical protein